MALFHKMHNNIAPEYLNDCLNEYLVANNYNLRNPLQYQWRRKALSTGGLGFSIEDIGVLGRNRYEIWTV